MRLSVITSYSIHYTKLYEVLEKPVGNYPYPYPVVDVESYYLWPEEKRYPPHYYYDPFYDPRNNFV